MAPRCRRSSTTWSPAAARSWPATAGAICSCGTRPTTSNGVLERQHIPHDVKEYPGVGHAFILDHPTNRFLEVTGKFLVGAGYDPAASEDAWRRILRFFGKHLGG